MGFLNGKLCWGELFPVLPTQDGIGYLYSSPSAEQPRISSARALGGREPVVERGVHT